MFSHEIMKLQLPTVNVTWMTNHRSVYLLLCYIELNVSGTQTLWFGKYAEKLHWRDPYLSHRAIVLSSCSEIRQWPEIRTLDGVHCY